MPPSNTSSMPSMSASYYPAGYQDAYHQHPLHYQQPHHHGYHQNYHHQAAMQSAPHHHQYYAPMTTGSHSNAAYQSPQTIFNYNHRYSSENISSPGSGANGLSEDISNPCASVGTAPCSSTSSASTATYLDLQHLTAPTQIKREYLPSPYVTPSPTLDLNNPIEADYQQAGSGTKTATVSSNPTAGSQISYLVGGNVSHSMNDVSIKNQETLNFDETSTNNDLNSKKSKFKQNRQLVLNDS